MLKLLWANIFYEPLYNALVFFASIIHDAGIAVILLTLVVKVLLFPLTKKSILSQAKLKALEADIEKIKKEFPDKTIQAQKTLALYKENKVNPFSSCLVVLIQFPIIIALYQVFLQGFSLQPSALYSFLAYPELVSLKLFGVLDIVQNHNILLAFLAGITQFIQMKIATVGMTSSGLDPGSFKEQFTKSMQFQMKYILPIFIAVIAYQVSAAIALYWVTSNVVSIVLEIIIRTKAGLLKKKDIFSF